MTWVVDSSVAVKWIAPEEGQDAAIKLIGSERELIAPEFLLVETGNTVWKKVRRGELSGEQSAQGLGFIRRVVQRFIPDELLADRALAIAMETEHPIYDCLYLACAEREDGTVATADAKWANKLSARFGARLYLLGVS